MKRCIFYCEEYQFLNHYAYAHYESLTACMSNDFCHYIHCEQIVLPIHDIIIITNTLCSELQPYNFQSLQTQSACK